MVRGQTQLHILTQLAGIRSIIKVGPSETWKEVKRMASVKPKTAERKRVYRSRKKRRCPSKGGKKWSVTNARFAGAWCSLRHFMFATPCRVVAKRWCFTSPKTANSKGLIMQQANLQVEMLHRELHGLEVELGVKREQHRQITEEVVELEQLRADVAEQLDRLQFHIERTH